MSGTSKTIVSICVLLLASLVLYYGMTPPQMSDAEQVDFPRPTMFGGDPDEKLAQLGFPPIAVELVQESVETPEPAPVIPPVDVVSEPVIIKPTVLIEKQKPDPIVLKETVVTTYTVRVGETLGEIASRELGSFRKWREIASLNGIDDPATIMPGRTLRMPTAASARKQKTPLKPAISTVNNESHRVSEGETLSSIAGDYYDDVTKYQMIVDANPSVDPSRLRIGMVLIIPKP